MTNSPFDDVGRCRRWGTSLAVFSSTPLRVEADWADCCIADIAEDLQLQLGLLLMPLLMRQDVLTHSILDWTTSPKGES